VPKRVSLKGKGADLFFGDYPAVQDADVTAMPATTPDGELEAPPLVSAADRPPASTDTAPEPAAKPPAATKQPHPAERNVRQKRTRASKPASTIASIEASTVEAIRHVIKVPGREVSYVRLTPEEKAELSDIVYTYRRQGQKTSETEINRIAINYLLLDYHEHSEQSVLARVLAALLA
jgi:hypothetical protein